ncbi:MAG: methyltransferase domain-containing protein [Solobacterium sp.]|nr:methyltransferase domain-containing protein [Solobacterium sp.]
MHNNKYRFFESDGAVRPEALQNTWFRILYTADTPYWNAERISMMSDKGINNTLEYVLRTLDILDEMNDLSDDIYETVRTVLCWSECAKGGTQEERARWTKRGYPLMIHNEASAMIYSDHCFVRDPAADTVCILIRTHGLAGQFIRGECRMHSSRDLEILAKRMGEEQFFRLLYTLNECIIRAVDDMIWLRVRDDVKKFIKAIHAGFFKEMFAHQRIRRLLPDITEVDFDDLKIFESKVFPNYDLWYFESALAPFGQHGASQFAALACSYADDTVRHLNFKPLADTLYYDYENRKHINTYKQRIIEKWLNDPASYASHVSLDVQKEGTVLNIGVRFTAAAEKLIDFCVEAERSGLLSYEKSITMLYDTFGFRRDQFDRLNNEESYLATMNTADTSTKLSILDYVKEGSILDVGSGGGVLLDELEKRFPDAKITGTDISRNVIEVLAQKKLKENRKWTACVHNFVEMPFAEKTDNIIFSSILHEIYSYTQTWSGKFDLYSVETALSNACKSLNPKGRIIIRDGVKTPSSRKLKITFKNRDGMVFFEQFVKDFRGMDRMNEKQRVVSVDKAALTVITDINYGREFLYTYTWGASSFAHECQECFGYYTVSDFIDLFNRLGMNVIHAVSLLEPGYEQHLSPLVELSDPDTGEPVPFPDSNCIIIAEK